MLAPAEPTECAASALRKITLRLIPFLFLLYIVAWLDRVNVGFAALQMNSALQFNAAVFGFGSGVFFLGYCLFEVPSNIILDHVGARLWIARIMISWGIVSGLMALVVGPLSFYAVRLLLGAAEAGFFPGVILYLTYWFPAEYRGSALVALHGSWNRSLRTGYKIIRVPFRSGHPAAGYDDFVVGWMLGEQSRSVWGRPVDLLVLGDGSLLISDDGAGKIWRVTYSAAR